MQYGRGKAKTIFAGGKGFCFASALFCAGIWYPPRRRVREECAAGKLDGKQNNYIFLFDSASMINPSNLGSR